MSNFSGDVAELGAEVEWEKFGSCCKLPPAEVAAMLLNFRTATESTNIMFFTGVVRPGQACITMDSNQFGT